MEFRMFTLVGNFLLDRKEERVLKTKNLTFKYKLIS